MSEIRFLIDENTPHAIRDQVLRRQATIVLLIWEAAKPDEYLDQIAHIPL